ncbi:Nucleotidyltransferase domain-containing protein [Evansella caseinilytica]|uniref:Nucleotidyltransferase domain-containing protein n=1 Tax=Evansella caseinilytica TaxID=1503961 RepID=A0A1H3HF73_9BACI|nr:nucleotidyltransferase domain-containing protein [Evansella caseinilytica]SDY14121.1 Nucleotidyltransferase domain-containing protein [Evansella caseinilytica]
MTNAEKRLQPVEAAKQFIQKHYPDCLGAVLAGSVVRGEATVTSDLDIVVFESALPFPYRESIFFHGWPIEVFVHNQASYPLFFEEDIERAVPTHPRMLAEGITIVDRDILGPIIQKAKEIIANGPEPWPQETIYKQRYFITDTLDDLLGAHDRGEEICSANTLAAMIHEFVLRTNRRWLGDGKWQIRALKQYDGDFAEEYIHAFDVFYRTGEKEKIAAIVDKVLSPYGGRIFDGFSVGKM